MLQKLSKEIKEAMKSRDELRLDALRNLKGRLDNQRKSGKEDAKIVKEYHAELAKSQEFFKDELLVKLEKELDIVKEFMEE